MNAYVFAIKEIKRTIPRKILEAVFLDKRFRRVTTIDDVITTKVLRGRLLDYLNIASQEVKYVTKAECSDIVADGDDVVYTIPRKVLGGRGIVAVNLAEGLGVSTHCSTSYESAGSHIESDLDKMVTRAEGGSALAMHDVRLLSSNTIMVKDANVIAGVNFHFKLIIENDANLTNIPPRSFIAFAKLAVAVTKAYIYNETIMDTGIAALFNGHELGVFKDKVDEYAAAEDDFQTLYEQWHAVAFLNNTTAKEDFFRNATNTY